MRDPADSNRKYEKRLTNAWKNRSPTPSGLAILIRDPDYPIKDIADLLRRLCGKRGRGKPGGNHLRWVMPHYLIAWFIERSGAKPTDERVSAMIHNFKGWAFMRNRRPLDPEPGSRDHLRVQELLRGSKRRRL